MIEDKLVKKAYTPVQYSKEQIEELRCCMDPVTGPMYFMENFMYIQHPTKGRMQFVPFEFQRGLVDAYHNYRKSINMVSRQMGKSTVAAGYLLWYGMFMPDSTILVASNKHDGALEIMQRIRYAYESVPDHIRAGVVAYNKKSIEFDNGSRIIAQTTTANTGRGLALSLIYMDELAFVEHNIARELWTSLSPTLSTGGKCIITSTPNIDEDQFAEIWFTANKLTDEYGNETKIGPNGFKPFFADWRSHPDRDEEWAKAEREAVGDDKFKREHECQFITFEETLINSTALAKLQGKPPLQVVENVRWYKDINPQCTYIISLDPSMGTGGDNAAIQVIELPTLRQVAEWQHNRTRIEEQIDLLRRVGKYIQSKGDPEIYWSVENNSLGEAALVVIRDTGEDHFAGSMLHDPNTKGTRKRKGFTTTPKSKQETCATLKRIIENGVIEINSKALIGELKTFVFRGGSFAARPGTTDDLVMSLILALRMADFVAKWDDRSASALSSNLYVDEDSEEESPMPVAFI